METLKTQKFCNITVAASWAKVADRGKGRQASSQERAERVTAASILQAALSRATARPTPDGQATSCVAERRVTSATTQPRSPAPGKQGRGHSCSVFMHVLCFNSPDSVFIHSFSVFIHQTCSVFIHQILPAQRRAPTRCGWEGSGPRS